ncbi:MAG: hypothetical protein ACKVU2_00295 [Saprospiraceae bacterium]
MKKHFLAALLLVFCCRAAQAQCTADAGPNQTLTCLNTNTDIIGSSNVPNATYVWTGPNGFTSTQPINVVSFAGVYSLTITDPSNGCTATDVTTVVSNTTPPGAFATGGAITCNNPLVLINGSSPTSGVLFYWEGPNGFQAYQPSPTVSVPGVYTLLVTNPANGCISTTQVEVTLDVIFPTVLATGGVMSCSSPNVTLSAVVTPPPPNTIVVWTGPSFTSTSLNPTVSQPGNYTFIATNINNGCSATATVQVTKDASFPLPIPTISHVKCNSAADGSVILSVSGGVSPYTYQWAGSNGFTASTQNLTNLPAGPYFVTVTDILGCSSTATAIVNQPAALTLPTSQIKITPVSCSGQNTGGINLPDPVGGTQPYSYLWSNATTTQDLSNLSAGTYTLTVTDVNGCTRTFSFIVGTSPLLVIDNVIVCENTMSASATGGTLPYNFFWSNGATGPTVTNLTPGMYTVTIEDGLGCTDTETASLSANATSCTRIIGKITHDENNNCLADSAEATLTGWFVQAVGPNGTYFGMSNVFGEYTISLLPGDYTVSVVANNPNVVVCQNDLPASLVQAGETDTADFLLQLPNPDCPQLSVSLSTPVLRRCFSNNFYNLIYCNDGPNEVPDAYVTLDLDPFLSIVTTNKPITPLGNNLFRFELGTLQPGFCGSIFIQVNVSCNAILGQVHCTEAHIYPDSICDPMNPLWSGALVEVTSECVGDSLHFLLKNIGTGNMTNELEYIVIEDGIMLRDGSAQALQSGETMTVTVPANGATWRVEAKQEPYAPWPVQSVLSVEGCTSTGSFSTGFVNQFPSGEQGNWVDLNCTANVGSYDPNDKQGFPIGYGDKHYVRPGTELDYLIRFQNTGTDTAFTVIIRDTLSPWLDPLSVRPGASSHNYRFELDGKGILIFDFQNILLPDSNVNEPASHGYVQFRISPRADVPLETNILNKAAIFFDFNDPIITNTTRHRIGENFVTVIIIDYGDPSVKLNVTPNPMGESSWISLTGTPATGAYSLRVLDLTGRPVREMSTTVPEFLLRKDDMPAGIYLFQVQRDGLLVGSGKLMVR